jgi:glycosidase
MHSRAILLQMLKGRLGGSMAARMWETMVSDCGYDHLLKAWLVMENHDTTRVVTELPQPWQQKMARVLQFTLPGTVCLYYGQELGMSGGEDPANRAPMRWDLASADNPTLAFHRTLLKLRRQEPALRWGDFRRLHSEKLFAFLRRSLSAKETVVVVANPTGQPVTEYLQLRESKLQDVTTLRNVLGPEAFVVYAGGVEITIPAHEVFLFKPDVSPYPKGYERYDRMP